MSLIQLIASYALVLLSWELPHNTERVDFFGLKILNAVYPLKFGDNSHKETEEIHTCTKQSEFDNGILISTNWIGEPMDIGAGAH